MFVNTKGGLKWEKDIKKVLSLSKKIKNME